jgi:hypothetical protein
MAISLRLKGAQELKNLQEEVKIAHEEKQSQQAQLEPLQEQAEQMIITLEAEKVIMEQV